MLHPLLTFALDKADIVGYNVMALVLGLDSILQDRKKKGYEKRLWQRN